MTKYFISLVLFIVTLKPQLFGQTSIQLDRPDQTECPFIVPVNYIQIENGFSIEHVSPREKSFSYPSSLWKYGMNERFELRLITELVSEKVNGSTSAGLIPITIGFKTNICREKGILPTTSFIGHITTSNIGSKEFHTATIAPAFRFTMQHTLNDRISLAYNLGAEWNGETPEPTYLYTLTTGITLTEKLGGYAEIYGFAPQGSKADHRFDCGLTYLFNTDFIVDLSGGFGLTENAPQNYLALGLSYRFKAINR